MLVMKFTVLFIVSAVIIIIIIIEHNLDVIKLADHIIDIGMEGGNKGGEIIAKGTPEEVARSKKSLTAKFLKRELEQ